MTRAAIARASARSPELYPGCPQQVCTRGTSTVQPASSSSLTAANPTVGRNRSTRQVTNRPTRAGLLLMAETTLLPMVGARMRAGRAFGKHAVLHPLGHRLRQQQVEAPRLLH